MPVSKLRISQDEAQLIAGKIVNFLYQKDVLHGVKYVSRHGKKMMYLYLENGKLRFLKPEATGTVSTNLTMDELVGLEDEIYNQIKKVI